MPGLIATGVCRYTVHGTYGGRDIANVLDFDLDLTGSSYGRTTAIAAQAELIVQAWTDHILQILTQDYVATSVSWVDLDDAAGTVGETTEGNTDDFPQAGQQAVASMPGNVAYRVNKAITAARGQRQGRMYLVGVPESATAAAVPNTVASATVTAINPILAAFLADVQISDLPTTFTSRLVVIHTSSLPNPTPPPANIVLYEGFSPVNGLTIDQTLASQRRRLRG